MPHLVGSLADTAADQGPFAGHADGLTRRPLFDRSTGAVHHSLVHNELAGRVERHRHAFEEGVYVLSGSLEVELAAPGRSSGSTTFSGSSSASRTRSLARRPGWR
jgi:quercetin dioxygenase-like cupin family protein